MPKVFGGELRPEELRAMTGEMRQLAGVRLAELSDGKARGMRVADVYTGGGLAFQVLLDRALDIGYATYGGRPLAWTNPALGGPELYEPEGFGWGRTWGGGLVTTCGLDFFGQPEEDDGERLGLHGRIAHQQGERVRVSEEWEGEEYVLEVEGLARQGRGGGESLLLRRRISTRLGSESLVIEDRVSNEGGRPAPHMLLYHCNFGWPVVSPASELLVSDRSVRPRDDAAAAGLDRHTTFEPPDPDYAEQVFFHEPRADAEGYVSAAIVNSGLGFGGYVRYRAAELPCLAQWKMMGVGAYVCALEPANQYETPRRVLREEGRLRYLAPGESIEYRLELGALPDPTAIASFEGRLRGLG